MGFAVIFGHTDEELTAAQWAVVETFRLTVDGSKIDSDTQRDLYEILTQAPSSSPEQWAAGAAELFVDAIVRLRADLKKGERAFEYLCWERDSLRRIVADYNANPLHEQIETMTERRDHWRNLAASAEGRVQGLENARRADHAELDRLRGEIADLNRIVAEQQRQLNDLMEGAI